MEVPCALLRTLEVFPVGSGQTDSEIDWEKILDEADEERDMEPIEPGQDGATQVRLSLDPEAASAWQLDVGLACGDADLRWPLPWADEANGSSALLLSVRTVSGVCRLELRGGLEPAGLSPAPLPIKGRPLPAVLDLSIEVSSLVVHVSPGQGAVAANHGRSLVLHMKSTQFVYRSEAEEGSLASLGRDPAYRTTLSLQAGPVSLAEIGRPATTTIHQVLALPGLDFEVRLLTPPYKLPTSYELLRGQLLRSPAESSAEEAQVVLRLDDAVLELVQELAAELADEFAAEADAVDDGAEQDTKEAVPSTAASTEEEFKYVTIEELAMSEVPLCADVQICSPVFFSFTGLSLTFPEVRLQGVTTTSFVLGQELIAHCIAFLLLNSPMLLGSCDLLGNPVQAYRHLRSGLGDLVSRPLREGVRSMARHAASASLLSVSALAESIRRNLPLSSAPVEGHKIAAAVGGTASSSGPQVTTSESGLAAGAKALLEGVGRGLVGVIRWEQHTPAMQRSGALGTLRGARNAMTGAVTHPVGGLLDFVTATARGWAGHESSSTAPGVPHASCADCLGLWPLRPSPEISPLKFHLQCCQGLPPPGAVPAMLFWSPRCELVRVDGADNSKGRLEPNLRLVKAGLLLTTAQLCVLVDSTTAHVLDIGDVQAVEEVRGRPSALVTIASASGRIWQLHVRGEPGEFVAHLRRARQLLGLPPAGAS